MWLLKAWEEQYTVMYVLNALIVIFIIFQNQKELNATTRQAHQNCKKLIYQFIIIYNFALYQVIVIVFLL